MFFIVIKKCLYINQNDDIVRNNLGYSFMQLK